VEGERYRRRLGAAGLVVSFAGDAGALVVTGEAPADAPARLSRLFDVGFDAACATSALVASPVLRERLARLPGLRPLGAWSPFELCVRTLLGQQVTVAAAGTLMRRLVARCGALEPAAVASADLGALGMPGRRAASVRTLAAAVAERRVDLEAPWPELEEALHALPGFGPWTRAYLGIRLGRDPDAFPDGDVGLQRAAGVGSARELAALAERWRPFRAIAATYLWCVPEPGGSSSPRARSKSPA
jgi:3-methyladenine DNA glycosylase/8-oxoguanine DNA glycosylase